MRHQSARVVFVACLAAAYGAAQAPVSFRPFEASDLGPANTSEEWSVPRFDLPALPQDPDYSLRGMFQQAHGMFMAGKSRYEPMAKIYAELFPDQRVKNELGSWEMFGHGIDIDLPIVLSTEGYLLLGAYYHQRHYLFTSTTNLSDENLTGAGIKLGFGTFLDADGNVLLEVETAPGMFSDADGGLHHQDYDFPSRAMFTVRAADHLYWKLGARYNQTFEDAPWLPLLGVSWDITGTMIPPDDNSYVGDSWRLDVLLPEYLELSYWPTASTGFQLGADIWGAEYHVRTSAATGRQRDNLRVQEVSAYFGFVQRFSDVLSLSVKTGAVVAGDHDLTNGTAGFNKLDGALEPGFFAHVSFGIDW